MYRELRPGYLIPSLQYFERNTYRVRLGEGDSIGGAASPYKQSGALRIGGMRLELIPITQDGELGKPVPSMPSIAAQVVQATTRFYRSVGYEPPWIGYFAIENGNCVGTCGFKSSPQNDRVEIAYFTFPGHESRGVATRMASELIRLATEKLPGVTVAAQTLPEESASTSVLKKLRFRFVDTVEHPEDGLVWEWQLSDTSHQ